MLNFNPWINHKSEKDFASSGGSTLRGRKKMIAEQQKEVRECPKFGSKLWNVVEYSAVTGLFHLLCSDCK